MKRAAVDALARGVPIGSGGSRLLRGNHPEHEALESEAAAFFGAEAALYFGGGYVANMAIFSTLPQRGDLVVHDELIHASVHEGMRRGRAETVGVAHNDVDAFDAAIARWRARGRHGPGLDRGRKPLQHGRRLAAPRRVCWPSPIVTTAMLVIDEAHATGVLGPQGRGLARAVRRPRQRRHAAHLRQGAGHDRRVRAGAAPRSATFSSIAPAPSSSPPRRRR